MWIQEGEDKWLRQDGCDPTRRPVRPSRVREICRGQTSTKLHRWKQRNGDSSVVEGIHVTDVDQSNQLCSALLMVLSATNPQYGDI